MIIINKSLRIFSSVIVVKSVQLMMKSKNSVSSLLVQSKTSSTKSALKVFQNKRNVLKFLNEKEAKDIIQRLI